MDRISVTDAALQSALAALQTLKDGIAAATDKCANSLSSQTSNLEDNFKKDVQQYVEAINQLKENILYCIDENRDAINDRLSKLPEYEGQAYRPKTYA